jgi:dephospho-CoA kinase
VLVGVEAPGRLRVERSRRRARSGDPETFEAFEAREREENSSDPAGQQLAATFRLADRLIANDGDLDALKARVDELLSSLGSA